MANELVNIPTVHPCTTSTYTIISNGERLKAVTTISSLCIPIIKDVNQAINTEIRKHDGMDKC